MANDTSNTDDSEDLIPDLNESDKFDDLIRTKLGATEVIELDHPVNTFEYTLPSGVTGQIHVTDNPCLMYIFTSIRHPQLLSSGDPIVLSSENGRYIFGFPVIFNKGKYKNFDQFQHEFDELDDDFFNQIPMANRIKYAWQLLEIYWDMERRSIEYGFNGDTIFYTGDPREEDTNIMVFDDTPSFYSGRVRTTRDLKYYLMDIFFLSTNPIENVEGLLQFAPQDISSNNDVMTFLLELIHSTDSLKKEYLSVLDLFSGMTDIQSYDIPAPNIGPSVNADFLPILVKVTVEIVNPEMVILFAMIDMWYRCSEIQALAESPQYAIMTIIQLTNRMFFESTAVVSIATALGITYNQDVHDYFEFLIMQHLNCKMYRIHLYEPAKGLDQLMASYVHIVPYHDIYQNVNIDQWYNVSLLPDSKPKNVPSQEALATE